MNPKEYSNIIEKTAVFPKKIDDFTLAYFTLGLYDELYEFYDKLEYDSSKDELVKEAGDVCWYACGICNYLNIDFEEVVDFSNEEFHSFDPFILIGRVKKFYRDNKSLNTHEVKLVLRNILYKVIEYQNFEISEVLKLNYNKLISRRENNTIHGDGDNR